MVHLNKNNLTHKQIDALFLQMFTTVAPNDKLHANHILTELLGDEERVMIAKRLAIIVLLSEGNSHYKIGNLLKVSKSTITNISKRLEVGEYEHTLKKVSKTKKDYFSFLEILDDILHLGGILPHYNGLDRYRGL